MLHRGFVSAVLAVQVTESVLVASTCTEPNATGLGVHVIALLKAEPAPPVSIMTVVDLTAYSLPFPKTAR